MPTYGSRWPTYAKQWDGMTLKSSKLAEIRSVAKRLVAAKSRYQTVEKATGVPWWVIACIHEREASQSWSASLAQGDPWNRVSTHVPRGRGPFKSWEAAAIDALHLDKLDQVKDWRLEKACYYWELFNGWGYYNRGLPSPYVWGATSVQRPGKYVADGVWSSTAVDGQLGTAAMLKAMMDLDPSIKPVRESNKNEPPQPPEPTPDPGALTGALWIQDSLNKILHLDPKLVVDGSIGYRTRAAIVAFQTLSGLDPDGKVGPLTSAAMDKALADLPKAATAPVGFWARVRSWFS